MRGKPWALDVTIVLGLFVLLLTSGSVHGQRSRPDPVAPWNGGGATSVMSPVVVAQWFTTRKAGVEQLELLVLWRGTPGWFMQPGGSGGSNDGTGGPQYSWIEYGDVTLSLGFDATNRIVTVQDKELALSDSNVLFVDDVDAPNGPRVIGTMAVAPALPGSAGQISPVLRGSTRIMSFLRCDAGSDSPRRAYLETLCMQNVGAAR